ncbi:GTPase ObgE [Candidatus Saccharibacteria bacterium]|nr:GTPase ObgE [Candidatus Saccharibacteria bacterium]
MFVDTAKVLVVAGKGGDGAVSFRHEIYIPKGGPDGGDGGRGGSIIFRADKDTNTLLDFRFNPEWKAENGKNGAGQRSAGRAGKDLIIEVPIGTVVKRDGEVIADLTRDQQEEVIAKGGDGGFGNAHFKSSTRQTPIIHELGEPGEAFEAELELKLLADVGLVGLPNAGKSTFLSVVTNAKPEIADYPITTITPNLGVATVDKRDILIADIPGLIEGASEGKGLGHAFLRHVDRTAVLLHLVDVYNDDAGEAYQIIRTELNKYSDLKNRPEIVALTKCEGLDSEIVKMQKDSILKKNKKVRVFEISSSAHQGLDELLFALKSEIEKAKKNEKKSKDSVKTTKNLDEDGIAHISLDSPDSFENSPVENTEALPVIKLNPKNVKNTWEVVENEPFEDGTKLFTVKGEKIEKFARRTDYDNYESLNRLRDIMKKYGIKAELTSRGAEAESIIEIAGHRFTLLEGWDD